MQWTAGREGDRLVCCCVIDQGSATFVFLFRIAGREEHKHSRKARCLLSSKCFFPLTPTANGLVWAGLASCPSSLSPLLPPLLDTALRCWSCVPLLTLCDRTTTNNRVNVIKAGRDLEGAPRRYSFRARSGWLSTDWVQVLSTTRVGESHMVEDRDHGRDPVRDASNSSRLSKRKSSVAGALRAVRSVRQWPGGPSDRQASVC